MRKTAPTSGRGRPWPSAAWSGLWPTWHDAHTPISVPEVEKKGKKVAVIGSGPAGIACAGDLAALGYEVTVFEKLTYAGAFSPTAFPPLSCPGPWWTGP